MIIVNNLSLNCCILVCNKNFKSFHFSLVPGYEVTCLAVAQSSDNRHIKRFTPPESRVRFSQPRTQGSAHSSVLM